MDPSSSSTITMEAVAARLGLSTMTVSRALRNARGVSVSTRERVIAAANSLGYRPDPTLAVLNSYRHGRRPAIAREKIVFLTNFAAPDVWRESLTFLHYFEGLTRRARHLGYDIEPFWLGAEGMTHRRASQILHQRGVRGIIVGPLAQGRSMLKLDWQRFSAVAIGRSLENPGLSTVSIDHFQVVEAAWKEVTSRGYQRIGLAITQGEDARTVGALRASYLFQQEVDGGERLPVFVTHEFSAEAISAWVAQWRPDVILSSEQTHVDLLQQISRRKRSDLAFVHLNVAPGADPSGIDQGHMGVGEHAAALLHLKLLQREQGVPDRRDLLLIHGKWKDGKGRWKLRPRLE